MTTFNHHPLSPFNPNYVSQIPPPKPKKKPPVKKKGGYVAKAKKEKQS